MRTAPSRCFASPPLRALGLLAAALLGLAALLLLVLALVGWNWARGPLQDYTLGKTGRELRIDGDLSLAWAWPPRLRAESVRLANPAWATAPALLVADAVEATVSAGALLRGRLDVAELRLERPQLHLEIVADAAGTPRKTWLFDLAQTDEQARIPIGRVLLDQGEVHYTDRAADTALRVALHTDAGTEVNADATRALAFGAEGRLRGQALRAEGHGGAVMAWHDDTEPYPLQMNARLGNTQMQAKGSVTSLLRLSALDLELDLRGDSLSGLSPLLRLPLPPTPPYRTAGRLVRDGALWRYTSFTGTVGRSDIAGTLQLDTGGERPMLRGGFSSRRLDLADLGPSVGLGGQQVDAGPSGRRVLPERPFDTRLWGRLDADVYFAALTLLRSDAQPLDRLQGHLLMQDRRLSIEPLTFGVAGGQLRGQLVLDARGKTLAGQATLQLRGVQLNRLLPALDLGRNAIGRLDGDATLSGRGASVGRMLAVADGRVSLVVNEGLISRLLMERIGLHLLEILRLNITGDETVALNCAVADFEVDQGRMQVRVLVLDTAVSTVTGSGEVNLAQESIDLRFVPRTKVNSVIALRSPLHLRGPLAEPVVVVDGAALATRGLGALALGLVNPLLALLPLFEAGPGADSPCARLVHEARAGTPGRPAIRPPRPAVPKPPAAAAR